MAAPADPQSWYYLPHRPDVRRDTNGAPMLSLVELGTSGYLLLSATWAARTADLDVARCEVANRIGESNVDRVRLSFAHITEPRCHVLIGDGSGGLHPVATSTTSAVPPYDAVFNVFLEGDRLVHAREALHGTPKALAIEYLAALPVPVAATATFRSIATDLLPWIEARSADGTDLRHLLDEAVERGLAAVAVDAPEDPGGRLAVRLYDRVLDRVARTLPRWAEQETTGDIDVAVAVDGHIDEPVRAFADIGALVAERSASAMSGDQDAAN